MFGVSAMFSQKSELEEQKIEKEIKDWSDWQGEMVDMAESQYC